MVRFLNSFKDEYLWKKQRPYSVEEWPFSSMKTESSSDWSLRRSHGRIEEESAISWTGAMLGRRPPVPFTVGGTSLMPESGGLVFWRSMATVPVNHIQLSFKSQISSQCLCSQSRLINKVTLCIVSHPCWRWYCARGAARVRRKGPRLDGPSSPPGWRWRRSSPPWWCWCSSRCPWRPWCGAGQGSAGCSCSPPSLYRSGRRRTCRSHTCC